MCDAGIAVTAEILGVQQFLQFLQLVQWGAPREHSCK
jgi:hypothetical protein